MNLEDAVAIKSDLTDIYNRTRTEQETDLTYINDDFDVPEYSEDAKKKTKIFRSGIGYEVVNSPSEQIITSNPQAIFYGDNKDIVNRHSKLVNAYWLPLMKRQNPNKFKSFVKKLNARGEAFIRLVHNDSWSKPYKTINGKPLFRRYGLPIMFLVPEPMTIMASQEEDEDGIPSHVIVEYERPVHDVMNYFKEWRPEDPNKKFVQWWEYWNKDERLFVADNNVVLKGANLYGFVPFIRKYSGYGDDSPDGDISSLIVSEIKTSRDLIKMDCLLGSDIAHALHLYAHPGYIIMSNGVISEENMKDSIDMGAGSVTVLDNLPPGTTFDKRESLTPPPEVFQHWMNIRAELKQKHPLTMSGFPFGESGRQQINAMSSALNRYATILENSEIAWSTAIECSFRMMLAMPYLRPDGISENDIKYGCPCELRLRADDPMEKANLMTMGMRLWNGGTNNAICLRTLHTKYMGMSQDESDNEVGEMIVDTLTLYDPNVRAVMGKEYAERTGMDKYFEQMEAEMQQQGIRRPMTPAQESRNQGQFRPGVGMESMDMVMAGREYASKGMRKSPVAYERS